MANKLLFKKTLVKIPTLHYDVYVVVTNDIGQAASKIRAAENPEEQNFYEQAAAMAMHEVDKGISYILITPKSDPGDIAHECWHVVRKIFEHIDAELENEMVAYHLGYLVFNTWDILKSVKKK